MESRVVKLYQNVGYQGGGHYKSFNVGPLDTFGKLKRRALDKNGINRIDAPFFSIIVKFQNNPATSRYRSSLRPDNDEIVCDVLSREELYHDGDIILIFSDIRYEHSYSSGHNRVPPNQAGVGDPLSSGLHLELCTEFVTHPYNRLAVDVNGTIPNILISELDSIALKEGRVQVYQPAKGCWR